MASEENNRGAFLIQQYYCAKMDAPIYAAICAALASGLTRDTRSGARVLDWPGEPTRDALPLRLIGGLHALVLARAEDELAAIFSGEVDVVVTDGFTGNVALKTMEGLANMLVGALKTEYTRNPLRYVGAAASWPVLRSLRREFDPRTYNGASMVGLSGVVIKSHGSADRISFGNAIRVGLIEARKGVPTQISNLLREQPHPGPTDKCLPAPCFTAEAGRPDRPALRQADHSNAQWRAPAV